jgi:metal transporter CNNM
MLYLNAIIVILLVALSAMFSALTLGLMSLNRFELKRKMALGDPRAKKIYPLRKRGNLLLCTLLLGNVAVNATISIFLGSITAGVFAGLIATGLIVVFGEILPQAAVSRYAMDFGARTAWLTWIFIIIFYPVARPIAFMLDKLLGKELPSAYSKQELVMLLKEQQKHEESDLEHQEALIAVHSLLFAETQVKDIMTPKSSIYSTQADQPLTARFLNEARRMAHSRIPVYRKGRIAGILYLKDLVRAKGKVSDIMRRNVEYVKETDKLSRVLRLFRQKRIHLFTVLDAKGKLVGIVTLEDVIEEIIGEIFDEHD